MLWFPIAVTMRLLPLVTAPPMELPGVVRSAVLKPTFTLLIAAVTLVFSRLCHA